MKKFKNIACACLIICSLISFFRLFHFGYTIAHADKLPQNRTRTATAQLLNIKDGCYATFETTDGNTWAWSLEKGDNFKKGVPYIVTFDNLGTQGIRDDIIISIRER